MYFLFNSLLLTIAFTFNLDEFNSTKCRFQIYDVKKTLFFHELKALDLGEVDNLKVQIRNCKMFEDSIEMEILVSIDDELMKIKNYYEFSLYQTKTISNGKKNTNKFKTKKLIMVNRFKESVKLKIHKLDKIIVIKFGKNILRAAELKIEGSVTN